MVRAAGAGTEADIVAAGVRHGTTRGPAARLRPWCHRELVWGDRRPSTVDGVDIHVEQAGPSTGPTLACLHGFASGDVHLGRASRPSCGTACGSSPGTGPRSGAATGPAPAAGRPYRLEADLGRTAALPADRHQGPIVLVGHSAGSLLAVQVALARDVRVDGLVLIAPAVEGGPPPAVRAAAKLPGSGLVAASLLRVGLRGAGAALRRSTGHGTPLTEATAAETGRTLRRPGTAAALWHLTATWEPPAVLDRLGEIGVPAVVIGGVDDRIVSLDQHRAAADGLHGAAPPDRRRRPRPARAAPRRRRRPHPGVRRRPLTTRRAMGAAIRAVGSVVRSPWPLPDRLSIASATSRSSPTSTTASPRSRTGCWR